MLTLRHGKLTFEGDFTGVKIKTDTGTVTIYPFDFHGLVQCLFKSAEIEGAESIAAYARALCLNFTHGFSNWEEVEDCKITPEGIFLTPNGSAHALANKISRVFAGVIFTRQSDNGLGMYNWYTTCNEVQVTVIAGEVMNFNGTKVDQLFA